MIRIAFAIFVLAVICLSAEPVQASKIVLVAGGGVSDPPCAATEIRLKEPFFAEPDEQGRLVISEMAQGQRVLQVDSFGGVTILAGTGRQGKPETEPQSATEASFDGIHNHAVDRRTGDIYFADTWNAVVRKLDARTGTIRTIAGTGEKGFHGDGGKAVAASFGGIYCVALDPDAKSLYLADLHNFVIRAIDLETGIVRRVAGNGKKGRPREGGIAVEEPLVDPRAVAADAEGNVYVLERGGHALRVVTPDGKIRTVVNTEGRKGQGGLGGPSTACEMNGPKHISIGREGSVLIADAENHRIVRYRPMERDVVGVAGTGKPGSHGLGGPPEMVGLNRPHGIFETVDGVIYVTDSYNDRVLKIVP